MSDRGSTSVLKLREFMTISQHVTKMLPNSEHNLHNDFKAGGQTNLGGTANGPTLGLSEGGEASRRKHPYRCADMRGSPSLVDFDQMLRRRRKTQHLTSRAGPSNSPNSKISLVFISLQRIPRAHRLTAQVSAVLGYNSGVLPVTECLHQCPGEPMTCHEVTAARSQLIYHAFWFSIFCF
jgi:hypothetical protein